MSGRAPTARPARRPSRPSAASASPRNPSPPVPGHAAQPHRCRLRRPHPGTAPTCPAMLLRYAGYPIQRRCATALADEDALQLDRAHLREILAILRTRTKHDFNGYKADAAPPHPAAHGPGRHRRISATTPAILRSSPNEVAALADDLMIHVTGFFRDPEAWEALRAASSRRWSPRSSEATDHPLLGDRLLQRRRGLHAGDALVEEPERPRTHRHQDLRHRHGGAFAGAGARRHLPRRHRSGSDARAARTVLRQGRTCLSRQEGAARHGGVRAAERAAGPAVLPPRHRAPAATC